MDKNDAKEMIQKYNEKADRIDEEIVRLLEKRMNIVAMTAAYKWRYGLIRRKEKDETRLIEKATAMACAIDLVEYTEGLLKYLQDIGKRYERKVARDLDWEERHS